MIEFDNRVKMCGMTPQIVLGLMVIEQVFKEHGYDCYGRSIVDGKHSKGSSHKRGMAIDVIPIRGELLTDSVREVILRKVQDRLTPEFQFIDEKDHYHLQWKPQ